LILMKRVSAGTGSIPSRQVIGASLADVHHAIVSCERCPRLRAHCQRIAQEKKRAHRLETYWGRPVTGFGDRDGRFLFVGLAPAAHGANRTGRIFTGDGSGDFLMAALHRAGFSNLPTSQHADDGLRLTDAYMVPAVRCAPPDNKPTPEEVTRCLDHLDAELAHLPRVRVVVALGKIAFDAWLQRIRRRGVRISPRPAFGHGVTAALPPVAGEAAVTLVGCYHPSRQNTNTGRLTATMMDEIFGALPRLLDALTSAHAPRRTRPAPERPGRGGW
jgi:uracil-DNA glycosylase family 4